MALQVCFHLVLLKLGINELQFLVVAVCKDILDGIRGQGGGSTGTGSDDQSISGSRTSLEEAGFPSFRPASKQVHKEATEKERKILSVGGRERERDKDREREREREKETERQETCTSAGMPHMQL